MVPKLLDALTMLFGNRPRYSVTHAASILRVEAAHIYEALALLESAKVVSVTDRGAASEAWHSPAGDGDLPALLQRIEALTAAGTLPRDVLETALG